MDRSGYDGFVAEFYDHVRPYAGREDLEFYRDIARAATGPVLELGCGTGRVLLPMLREGAEVCGLDGSRPMLAVCVEKLAREPEAIRERAHLMLADMRHFELGRHFALALTPFRSFQHLITVEDQLACLRCIHEHLLEDGRLVLDLFNPSLRALTDDERTNGFGAEEPFALQDGRVIRRSHRVAGRDFAEQVLDAEIIYDITHPDGREERLIQAFPMRWLYRFEAEHLLARAGFELESVLEDFAGSPFTGRDGSELLLIARKR